MKKTLICIETLVNRPVNIVWQCFTDPENVKHWNHASDDWHTPNASSDLQPGGRFCYRMEAKDGSFGFDFEGVYQDVIPNSLLSYKIGDGRDVRVEFMPDGDKTRVMETFEAETMNSIELQREGWQAILDNFSRFAEQF